MFLIVTISFFESDIILARLKIHDKASVIDAKNCEVRAFLLHFSGSSADGTIFVTRSILKGSVHAS